ncbi:hypothetical protein A2291_03670 [candidate division WOR-1 bacterium RIFOXYB2_FULL_42_35]|uniref:Uncharacterized protein n=1 Tax=candidate division WOR-1 bacterium RIFOXYC2_FULL_41_25 TaxID=1802586 RepID=A0A1F4TSE6_UNCSA|nr:MAG: hypothetical protein A2247_03240 [candidate division WOR-1 bacterium RIFOXYA2_FULL_41_14]OGC25561.1 MAG: hypothetical protein A2291_03670 [candidate division WOR-1 bacterium RIFOXYB2_FULL_42_35]OGC34993.1 MAG: hypothetical protein A2462_05300 [candidate division WOR-1 bacterium RIFOXYC2_FULL_41_25]OGC41790.1 MAG: hypothetical protein A2548_03505 [candidate division WOR-1 bacterium RIFOXYD2_FULL_41_8]
MSIQQKEQTKGPDLKALGLKSPMEVIDILALIKIDGKSVINDHSILLNPKAKAQAVVEFYHENFNVKPNDLPHIASMIKKEIIKRKGLRGQEHGR